MEYKKGLLNIVTCHNQEFSAIARHCCRGLSNKSIHINCYRYEDPARGFRSPEWYGFVRKKIELLVELYRSCEENEVVGMVDADIQFFDSSVVVEAWKQFLKTPFVYAGLMEGCGNNHEGLLCEIGRENFNTGFMLIKKSPQMDEVLEQVLSMDFRTMHLGDQDAFNHVLRSKDVKRVVLNPRKFTHGCCGPIEGAVSHHATCCYVLDQKINQMEHFRRVFRIDPPGWDNPSYGDSCSLF
jgi:hypothetical protein